MSYHDFRCSPPQRTSGLQKENCSPIFNHVPKVSKIPYDLFSLSRMLPLLSHHCNVFVSLLKEKKRRRKRQRKRGRKGQRIRRRKRHRKKGRKRQRKRCRKGMMMMMVGTLPLTDGPTPPPATNFAPTNISDSKISS